MRVAMSVSFLVLVGLGVYFGVSNNIILITAALFGAYMAINIGANDVANSVGPAVGSKAITLKWAIVIAAVGNIAGATIAGGDVVKTIKKGIIDISGFGGDTTMFMCAMLASLLAAALWLHLATYFRAPVSTTHSIVGGVMGTGIAALGVGAVSWMTMGKIIASWFISPVLGGIIAAIFLYFIKQTIIYKTDKVSSAVKWVPFFVAIMAWAFTTYLIVKGLKKIIKIEFGYATLIGIFIAIITFIGVRYLVKKKAHKIKNNRESINKLFTIPLVFSVALLTFAHGANDVANAIGPLTAIYDSIINGGISTEVNIPIWILILGGAGISVGLALFGPRIIKTVGGEITELNRTRAFAIALAASITVIIASQLGLPVSSTHIALGGVFGVGFLRERLHKKNTNKKEIFVQRSLIWKIISGWIITVPIVAFISGMIFLILTQILH